MLFRSRLPGPARGVAQYAADRDGLGSGGCPGRGGRASPHVRGSASRRHACHRSRRGTRNSGTSASQLFAEFGVRPGQPRGPAGACSISRSANAVARPGRRAASPDACSKVAAAERGPAIAILVTSADAVTQAQAVSVSDAYNHAAASADANSDPHANANANADPHTDADANGDPHTDAHRHGDPHAAAISVSRP